MSLTTITNRDEQGIDISRFSEKQDIAQLQADTLRHAMSVRAQLAAEVSPEYQATKRVKINAELAGEQNRQIHNTIGIMILAVCFVFFIGHVATRPITPPVVRTIEHGDLEATNKILQRELMLTKSELDAKIREVEMLEREFKNARKEKELSESQ